MSLTEEERERLADLVRLQPTKNSELQERWGMESGSEVHQYLENHLQDHYYRDDDSLIRATDEAAEVTGVEPAVEGSGEEGGVPEMVRVPALQARILEVLPAPDEESESVVSVLNSLREDFDLDPTAEAVRQGLQSLRRKNVVDVVYRTVPTFRLAAPRDEFSVEELDESGATADPDPAADEFPDDEEFPATEEFPDDEDVIGDIEEEFTNL